MSFRVLYGFLPSTVLLLGVLGETPQKKLSPENFLPHSEVGWPAEHHFPQEDFVHFRLPKHGGECFVVTVDGRNPAPVDMVNIPLFTRLHTCWVVQDFFHQQYVFWPCGGVGRKKVLEKLQGSC